jgi:site-specific recombinase XerD
VLAGLDSFYRHLGLGPPDVRREDLAAQAPRALSPDEQRDLLRAVERRGIARDRAIVALDLFAGLRLAELAGLDTDDVAVSAWRGRVRVRHGKGDAWREVPLGTELRQTLETWLATRPESAATGAAALFVGYQAGRMTPRAVDLVIRRIGADAGFTLSAHVLRHSFCTNLVRAGHDLVLVAELAGHRRVDTTRRYSLPSAADKQAAIDTIAVDC